MPPTFRLNNEMYYQFSSSFPDKLSPCLKVMRGNRKKQKDPQNVI